MIKKFCVYNTKVILNKLEIIHKIDDQEVFRVIISVIKLFLLIPIFSLLYFFFYKYQQYFVSSKVIRITTSVALSSLSLLAGPLLIFLSKKNSSSLYSILINIFSALYITLITILNLQFYSNNVHTHIIDLFGDGLGSSLRTILIVSDFDMIFSVILLFVLIFISTQIISYSLSSAKIPKIKLLHPIPIYLLIIAIIFLNSELVFFFSPKAFNNPIIKGYENFYNSKIEENKSKVFQKNLEAYDKIFIIQLESLSSVHIKPEVTPNLFEISKKGVLYKNLQASSTNTIRNLETNLCGLPPSLGKTLSQKLDQVSELNCIPKILKQNGFKTIFLKHSGVNLSNTKEFLKMIGFDEVHTTDLFINESPPLEWGYSDDVAYKNYFKYLNTLQDEKLFVYMEVGSVNHYPFNYYHEINEPDTKKLDFNNVCNLSDVCISTWLQDKYLGNAFRDYFEPKYLDDTALIIFGDNPWPDGIHKGNFMNISNAYEENFLTSMVLLDPKNLHAKESNKIIEKHYGGLEISNILLDLSGFEPGYVNENNCIISVQPFTEKKIIFKMYPMKYIVDVYDQRIDLFDLSVDPGELVPITTDLSFSKLMDECISY